jgi:hypothetical protein
MLHPANGAFAHAREHCEGTLVDAALFEQTLEIRHDDQARNALWEGWGFHGGV